MATKDLSIRIYPKGSFIFAMAVIIFLSQSILEGYASSKESYYLFILLIPLSIVFELMRDIYRTDKFITKLIDDAEKNAK